MAKDNKEEIEDLKKQIEDLEEEAEAYERQDNDKEDQYDEFLDDAYGEVQIGGYSYSTSKALKDVDEIAYNEGFSSWANNEMTRLKEEIDDLKDQVKALEEE